MTKIKAIVLISAFLSFCGTAKAENTVFVRDTFLVKNVIHKIPVYGSITRSETAAISIELLFDGTQLDISGVEGCAECMFQSAGLDTTVYRWDSVSAVVSSNYFRDAAEGLLFYLNTEVLSGKDTITYLTPKVLTLGGTVDANAKMTAGKISTTDPTVIYTTKELLGNPFPNPTSGSFHAKFTIAKPTKVKFSIYDINGSLVQQIPSDNSKPMSFKFYDTAEKEMEYSPNNELAPGVYTIKVDPMPYLFASGAYLLFMETDFGVSKTNFMFVK